jgi:hypothetical protein
VGLLFFKPFILFFLFTAVLQKNRTYRQYSTNLTLKVVMLSILLQTVVFIGSSQTQQKMLVKGVVTDQSNREPVPFCNIVLSYSKTGTISQTDGVFTLQVPLLPDTIVFSAIGYETFRLPVLTNRENIFEVKLTPKDIQLSEVVINPTENPANIILRRVIERKSVNNPLGVKTIACNAYTKVLANSVGEGDNKLLLKSGIPIFFSEKYSQNYVCNNPFFEKERVIEEKLTGLGLFNELSIFGITSSTSIEFNFYNSIVEVLDKPFISPLNSRAFSYYRFYLRDSMTTSYGKEYLIEFKPRNTNDLAFTGYLKVIDEMWALSEISAKVPIDANLNYINKMEVFQSFLPVNDSMTFFHINEVITELKLTKDNSLVNIDFSAIVDKRTIFSNVKLNFPPQTTEQGDGIWDNEQVFTKEPKIKELLPVIRPEEISLREQKAILTIDSLNNRWKVKATDGIARMFLTGYIPGKHFDIGPYIELMKYNKVEGYRFTLAGRTSAAFTKNTMLYGHLGYGFRDNEWKYGAGVKFKLDPHYRRIATLDYRNDLSRVGDNRSIFLIKENMMVAGEDNVIAALFTGKPLEHLSREVSYRAEYEHEWRRGFINLVSFNHRKINSGQYMPFIRNNLPVDFIATNEITLGARFSWKEAVTDNYCRRYYMSTKYPIVNIRLTGGQYRVENIADNYLIARAVVNHDINIGLTKFEYILEGGYSLGTRPFPLLEIHRADQSIGYALYSFSMMNEMEYASDRFISLMAQYHLNGLLFNRVPLLKKTGIREVFSAKVLWSHLGKSHEQVMQFPATLSDARIPYSELSAGIENIFQYFRVDVVCRLSQNDSGRDIPLGVKFRFDFNF